MLLEFICPGLWGVANLAPRTNGHRRIAELKIPALVADFCTYYAPHPNKTVIYYYDATALGSNYAVNDQDFHWVVVHEFERNGWQVIDVYLGNTMRHDDTSAARSSHSTICTQ